MPVVIVDSREPTWIQNLTFGGCHVATSTLDLGDIQVIKEDGSMLIIERKTVQDLLNSIADGRLLKQAANIGELIYSLAGEKEKRTILGLLLVTGVMYPHKGKVVAGGEVTNWHWSSVQGALLKCQTLGMEYMHLESEIELEKAVIGFLEKAFIGDYELKPTRVFKELGTTVEVLACLPGIGLQRAISLSQQADNNLMKAFELLTRPDIKIAGIGEKTKEAIRKAIGLGENQHVINVDETIYDNGVNND